MRIYDIENVIVLHLVTRRKKILVFHAFETV